MFPGRNIVPSPFFGGHLGFLMEIYKSAEKSHFPEYFPNRLSYTHKIWTRDRYIGPLSRSILEMTLAKVKVTGFDLEIIKITKLPYITSFQLPSQS